MADVSRSQLAVYVAAAIAIALLGARYVAAAPEQTPAPSASGSPAVAVEGEREGGGRATVHVAGAVRRPGVYRLTTNARVADAVERAGGATRGADLAAVNLAAEVKDGRQVLIPRRGEAATAGGSAAAGGGTAGGTPGAPATPINLNTATVEQLDTLEGIGPGIAQRILAYREEQGGFGDVEELGQVPGIGEKRMAALREQVTV